MNIKLDCHLHTLASGHAYSTITEYAQEAANKHLELIAITDHEPNTLGMPFDDIYFGCLYKLPTHIHGVEVLRGVELNILNTSGDIDMRDHTLSQLDVVMASLHGFCFPPSTRDDNTQAVIQTMKNRHVKIIGHLGGPEYPLHIQDIVKAARDYGVALEINEAALVRNDAGTEANFIQMIEYCMQDNTPVIWGSDAHYHMAMGEFAQCRRISEGVGLPANLLLNTSVEKLKAFVWAGRV